MNRWQLLQITAAAVILGTGATAETNYDDPAAIMMALSKLSDECAAIEEGHSQFEVFGVEIIRVGDTCAIINSDELDDRVRVFLEEENLPWAGVGIWVKAEQTSE